VDRVTDWSVLRRVRPYRPDFGTHRGDCVDRFYVEKFLAACQESIKGHVAEIGGDDYVTRFGGGRVSRIDILDLNEQNDGRTMTIDLIQTEAAPEDLFDCIICTQVLLLIFDYHAALLTLYKMLKPGGVLLVTVPGISQRVSRWMLGGQGQDCWRFTGYSMQRAVSEIFEAEETLVQTYGNVLTATAFLHGLTVTELTQAEFEYHDPDYEVIIGVRAMKPQRR
jgi:hypothetical protein